MAAIEEDDDVRSARRDFVDQHGQLLVRDRADQGPVTSSADIDRHEGLDPTARFERGELRRGRLLAAVAAVREQDDIAGGGLPEV